MSRLILFSFLAVSCVQSYGYPAGERYLADGTRGEVVRCQKHRERCLEVAGELCRERGYDVLDEERAGRRWSLVIRCKPDPSVTAEYGL